MNYYEDIINLPHHEPSPKHQRMSIYNRSAQFAPFSALTGYGESIKEMARLVDDRIILDESVKEMISNKLAEIINNISSNPKVTITYFIPDSKKKGGKYVEVVGNIKKVDTANKIITLTDKTSISINEIINIS